MDHDASSIGFWLYAERIHGTALLVTPYHAPIRGPSETYPPKPLTEGKSLEALLRVNIGLLLRP
jgi:hypothetical protein